MSHRIGVLPLRLVILVDGSGTDSTQQSGVLSDILLDVSGSGGILDREMNRLILGVIGTGSGDGGEDVEREDAVGRGVIDRSAFTIEKRQLDSSGAETRTYAAGFVAAQSSFG